MTTEQISICLAFSDVRTLPGSWNKRFMKKLTNIAKNNPETELTEPQIEWMYRLLHTFRKQLPINYNLYGSHPLCKGK